MRVNVDNSDPAFRLAPEAVVDVVVRDHQFSNLRIGEDDTSIHLKDEASELLIDSNPHGDGIQVVANDRDQTITLEALVKTEGTVHVDAAGGNDTVVVHGDRFDSINGGEGIDQLVLGISKPVELAEFLAGRVSGFEEIVIALDSPLELTIDAGRVADLASAGTLLIQAGAEQELSFLNGGVASEPIMVGEQFAQVIAVGDDEIYVVSGAPWRNVYDHWDVNYNGGVTSLDALVIVNELARVIDPLLPMPITLENFSGAYFDVSGDGRITALDALRVINEIARRLLNEEGEAIAVDILWNNSSNHSDAKYEIESIDSDAQGVPTVRPSSKIVSIATVNDEAIRELSQTSDVDSVADVPSSLIQPLLTDSVELKSKV